MPPRTTRRSRSLTTCLALGTIGLVVPVVGTGCAAQDRMDHTVAANRSLREQLAATETERDHARNSLRTVQGQLSETQDAYATLEGRYEELETSVTGLNIANEESMKRIARLELGPLPEEVESAIAELAASHPELLTFDAEMGMVRFSSDFTFDLGSVAVRSDASETLSQLASILNESAGRSLEVRVIGHTDDVPIGRPETRRQHPTNVHLSVHRAIAVRQALTGAGLEPARIQVAGYGEFRPIVPNGKRGAAANRRVEIFLAPMTDATARAAAMPPADEPAGNAAAVAEPSK